MDREVLFEQVAEENLRKVLAWAVRKTGNRSEGEDLAQEVFVQFYDAVSKAETVDRPENLLWKVAYHCWCNYLRSKSRNSRTTVLDANIPDGIDYANETISAAMKNERISRMRREIMNLSFIQREAMILHHLDGLTVAETAAKLGTTESAVTWHLFDARKKVRREIESMSIPRTNYVYRPGRLRVGISGGYTDDPDTKRINDSLVRQNLCLLCYREPKTIDELVELTGIPRPYIEFDLDWLVNREFMTLEGKKYATAFPIIGRRHMQEIATLYMETRGEFQSREIVANAIGRYLLNLARNGEITSPIVLIVDEAHNFLGRNINSEDSMYRLDAIGLIAKEGRKYGLNICLSTQRPRDIPEDVLSQMGTLVVHRLVNDSDREVVERACGEIDRAATSFLPNLKPGEAAIIGIDFPIPLTVQVRKPSTPPKSDGPDYQRKWQDS